MNKTAQWRGCVTQFRLLSIVLLLNACTTVQQPADEVHLQRLEGRDANAILFLQGEEKIAAFRNARLFSPTRRVAASDNPYALPDATSGLSSISFDFAGTQRSFDSIFAHNKVAGLIVIKNDKVMYERYGLGNSAESRWISFSVAKSVVSLLIGAAIKDGYINSVDDKLVTYLPLLRGSAYEQASIKDLLQMASGVEWNEDYGDPNSDVAGADYATLALYEHLRKKSSVAKPGELFNYNTAETNLAGTLLRSAIGNNLATYLQEKIWQPFGMESDAHWQLTEPGGGEFGGCCINATLRDYARIGLFAMAEGRVSGGEQVLPKNWMKESTAPSRGFDGYGYFWWLNQDGTYQARGIFGQGIYINPATNTVIAIHSAWENAAEDVDKNFQAALFKAIDRAM